MNMPLFTKEKTCFFAGHRPYRFSFPPDQERAFYENLILNIRSAVRSLVLNGCDTFLCGGSIGFDILCAEEVILLKREFPFVKLVCVLPFEKHYEINFLTYWHMQIMLSMLRVSTLMVVIMSASKKCLIILVICLLILMVGAVAQ